MTTYVLVHGAFHGGWCWRKVTPLLRAAGHEVFTPTLTGLGERSHLLSPDTGLETHVRDLVNVLEYEDLEDIVLVGHSYAGMVVTGALARCHERIRQLVYLDALVPTDGQSARDALSVAARQAIEDGVIQPFSFFGVTDADDLAWLAMKMTPHPGRTMTDKVSIPRPVEDYPFGRTYVFASKEPLASTQATAARLRDHPAWRYVEMPEVHDMMITAPEALTRLLLDIDEPSSGHGRTPERELWS